MICQQVMQRQVRVVADSDPVAFAARIMNEANIGFLPVSDARGKVVGVLTDRDIVVRAMATGLSPSVSVGLIMTPEVVACRPRDDLFHAQHLMRTRGTSRVLCLDDAGRPVGVISFSDVARNEDGFRLANTARQMVNCPPSPASYREAARR